MVTDFRDMQQAEHDVPAKAKRSLLVDSSGDSITRLNPLPITYVASSIVRWTTSTDFNKGTNFNTAVTGTGEDAYVGLASLDNNSDNVPFTAPADYTYDSSKIEVTGGKAALKLASGASQNWPFTTPSDYTYDSAKIEVTSGVAKFKKTIAISPYAWWHMNESSGTNVADSSGNGRNGTTVNMENEDWQVGKLNNCLNFNEGTTNEYVDCGNIANFERTDKFSMEAWIKTSVPSKMIIARHNATAGWFMYVDSDGKVMCYLSNNYGGSNNIARKSASVVTTDTWRHIVLTYDGSSTVAGFHIYIDGALNDGTALQDSLTASILVGTNTRMGNWGGSALCWRGKIDEVVIYSQTLTSNEVTARYNSGTGTESMPLSYYSTIDKPSIYPVTGLSFPAAFTAFTETATKPANTEIKYQVTFNDGVTWKWWNGASWVSITGGQTDEWYYANEANLASDVNTNIGSLASSGTFRFKAFLNTTTASATPQLDNIYVTTALIYPIGSYEISMNTDIQPTINWGYLTGTETVTKPANTDLKYQYSTNSGSTYNGDWLDLVQLVSALHGITCYGSGTDKIRFKFQLTTNINISTPEIDNLNVTSSSGYKTSGTYTSNSYNSAYIDLDWKTITYGIDLPAGTTIVFKVRTSNDGTVWGLWSSAYASGEEITETGKYIQWKVDLTGTGFLSPKVNSNSISYISPAVSIITP